VASSPPIQRPRLRPGGFLPLDLEAFRAHAWEEGGLCFAVCGAPPGCTETVPIDDGVQLVTHLHGQVLSADEDRIVFELGDDRVAVRALLPRGLGLATLAGRFVRVTVSLLCHPRRPPTVDAVFRDEGGSVLLWARDGAPPTAREAACGAVRIASSPSGPRLAVVTAHGARTLAARDPAQVRTPAGAFVVLPIRVAPDGAAFVFLRR